MIFLQRGQLNASAAAPPKTDEPESASVMASFFSPASAATAPASRDQYTPSRLWMTPGGHFFPAEGTFHRHRDTSIIIRLARL